jgi:hypothetical protein
VPLAEENKVVFAFHRHSAPRPQAISTASPPRGIEKRQATRVPRHSRAQLIFWPANSRIAPIEVEVVDYSTTGIGLLHTEGFPPGQKFIVREPFVTGGSTCIYTVVRSDPRKDGMYSIGLHIGNTMIDDLEKPEEPVKPIARTWQFLYFLFALVGTLAILSAVLLRHLRGQ